MNRTGRIPTFACLTLCVGALLLLAGPASAERYNIYDDHGGTWADAEKASDDLDDDLLCWAASSSNVLWYTGWGRVGGMTDADTMFTYFQDHWSDFGGNPYYGWDWWFDGTNDMQGNPAWAQETPDGGGGFYPAENINSYRYYSSDDPNLMLALDVQLHAGYASTLGIAGNIAHSITAWGYEFDGSGYKGVYVTDSDDDKGGSHPRPDSLRYYEVSLSGGHWYLQNYGVGNYISEVVALAMMPGSGVPEPSALALMGLGLLGIAAWRIRRRR